METTPVALANKWGHQYGKRADHKITLEHCDTCNLLVKSIYIYIYIIDKVGWEGGGGGGGEYSRSGGNVRMRVCTCCTSAKNECDTKSKLCDSKSV